MFPGYAPCVCPRRHPGARCQARGLFPASEACLHLRNPHRRLLAVAMPTAAALITILSILLATDSRERTRPADSAEAPTAGLSVATAVAGGTVAVPSGVATLVAAPDLNDLLTGPPQPEATPTNTRVPVRTLAPPTAATAGAAGFEAGREQARAWLIEAGWPDHLLEQALNVVRCESSYNPYARNGVHYGLFQISDAPNATIRGSWFTYWNVPLEEWSNPVVNAQMAWWMYQQSAWGNWSCQP